MLLQCPITLADTYRLICADLSGIRLPLVIISKNNFSQIHIRGQSGRFLLSPIIALALADTVVVSHVLFRTILAYNICVVTGMFRLPFGVGLFYLAVGSMPAGSNPLG